MRRPLIGIAAAGLSGTLVGLAGRPPVGPQLAALFLLWALLTAALFRPAARMGLVSAGLALLTFGLAALAASLAALPVAPSDIRLAINSRADPRPSATLTGVVNGDPIPIQRGESFAMRFPLQVETVGTGLVARTASGAALVTWHKPREVPPPAYGERWVVQGRVTSRDPLCLSASSHGVHFLARGLGDRFRQFCERRRRGASRILSAGIADHPDEAGLLQALLLGTRIRLPASIKQDFMTTGTFHVIAISGLHVGMVSWLLASILRLGGISRVWWFPILAPLLLIYTMGTGASASALRACIMACLFFAASLVGRRSDGPSALAAAALLIVVLDPFQVLDRGFILSFCLVGGLLLVAPLLQRAVPAFLKPDPFLADDLIPAWKRTGLQMLRAVWATLALSAAAWFTSLPLCAYFFGTVSLVSLVGNLVAIPMSFLIVLTGSLSFILGSVWLLLGEILNYANLALIAVLVKELDLLAAIPHASVHVPRPPLWVLPVWYAIMILPAFRLHLRYRQSASEPIV